MIRRFRTLTIRRCPGHFSGWIQIPPPIVDFPLDLIEGAC